MSHNLIWLLPNKKRKFGHAEGTPGCMHTEKNYVKSHWEAICTPKREVSEETTLPGPWSLTSNLRNCEEINFCGLKPPDWYFVIAAPAIKGIIFMKVVFLFRQKWIMDIIVTSSLKRWNTICKSFTLLWSILLSDLSGQRNSKHISR